MISARVIRGAFVLQKKYLILLMIRRLLLPIFCLFYCILLQGQPLDGSDSTLYAQKDIKIFVVRKSNTVQPVIAPPLIVTENKTEETKPEKETLSYKTKPTLYSDKDGLLDLMQLEPFAYWRKAPKTGAYVVFSFNIDEWGFVSEINIYDTNDRALVDQLIHKLDKTRWNAALTMEGKRAAYKFGNWIAMIPTKIKPKEYEDYRF
jgi:hypothetical protein